MQKKRGPWETEGKKIVSFVFRNQLLILLCFSPNDTRFPPILLLSLFPPPLLRLGTAIRFGKEKTWDFPTVLREQT